MDLDGKRPRWPINKPEQFRAHLLDWIQHNWDHQITVGEWWDRLARTGLTAPTWPRSQGGLAATTAIQQIIETELANVGAVAPPVTGLGIGMVGAAIRQFASETQFAQTLPGLLTGEHMWTALIYEPGVDDPTATRCAGEIDWKYVTVNGIKLCTEPAATHAIMLVRSQPTSTGRDGLTWLMVELGYHPVDHATGTVSFSDARFLHDRILGKVDHGWEVAKVILPFMERSYAGRIRRGLVNVQPGGNAGNLTRVVGDVLVEAAARAQLKASAPGAVERRRR